MTMQAFPTFTNPANNPSVAHEYAKQMARQRASELAAQQATMGLRRRLGSVDDEAREKAMRRGHVRVSQIAQDNWDFLDEHLGGFLSQEGRVRLAHYMAQEPIFIDQTPYPVLVGRLDQDSGELSYDTHFLPGTPGPWLARVMAANTRYAVKLMQDYASLQARYLEPEL